MALPKFIYIFEEQDNTGARYFIASTDPGEKTEGKIGVYDLREILTVRHKLQFLRPGTKSWIDSTK